MNKKINQIFKGKNNLKFDLILNVYIKMDKLLIEKNKLVKEKYELLDSLKITEDRIKEIDTYIINNCKHEWIKEKETNVIYPETFTRCLHCGLQW